LRAAEDVATGPAIVAKPNSPAAVIGGPSTWRTRNEKITPALAANTLRQIPDRHRPKPTRPTKPNRSTVTKSSTSWTRVYLQSCKSDAPRRSTWQNEGPKFCRITTMTERCPTTEPRLIANYVRNQKLDRSRNPAVLTAAIAVPSWPFDWMNRIVVSPRVRSRKTLPTRLRKWFAGKTLTRRTASSTGEPCVLFADGLPTITNPEIASPAQLTCNVSLQRH